MYGKLSIVPWNIVKYNIFGGSGRGPELYGTEPWHYYLLNLLLNFNVLVPFALAAWPALAVTYFFDRSRLSLPVDRSSSDGKSSEDSSKDSSKDHAPGKPHGSESSPYTLLAFRLAPFYVWFAILTMQPHKEERFMFPIYTILVFNAAVTLYLVRGWFEVVYIRTTASQYRVS
jgi:alpha-1,2-mannosyltransferase